MVITQPTVDDFSDTTVMRVIRKIVNYICNDLVDGINNNDIVSGQFSVQGNQLSGILTKGDGKTIDIPAITLPSGGGGSDNPYPTAVSMTLSGTTLNLSMTMSSGPPITGSVNLASILSGYATVADVTAIKPTVTVNDSVSPPTISVTVNGTTSTANLPTSIYVPTLIESILDSDISTILTKLNKNKGKFIFISSRGFRKDEGGSDNYNYLTFSGVITTTSASSCIVNGCGFIARNDFNNRANTSALIFRPSYIEVDKNTSVGSVYSRGLSVNLYTLDISSIMIIG